MTEQPDTAALRAERQAPQWVWELMDALDGARADRALYAEMCGDLAARAEMAEAETEVEARARRQQAERAERAEAELALAHAAMDLRRLRAETAEQKRDNYELLWRAAEDEQNAAIARADAAERILHVWRTWGDRPARDLIDSLNRALAEAGK